MLYLSTIQPSTETAISPDNSWVAPAALLVFVAGLAFVFAAVLAESLVEPDGVGAAGVPQALSKLEISRLMIKKLQRMLRVAFILASSLELWMYVTDGIIPIQGGTADEQFWKNDHVVMVLLESRGRYVTTSSIREKVHAAYSPSMELLRSADG
jgi:hypothetical protein